MLFDPRRYGASDEHARVYGIYQVIGSIVDFLAAVAFVIGSILFFYPRDSAVATWFFLVGSIFFAVRPTVAVARELHLARLPVPDTTPSKQESLG